MIKECRVFYIWVQVYLVLSLSPFQKVHPFLRADRDPCPCSSYWFMAHFPTKNCELFESRLISFHDSSISRDTHEALAKSKTYHLRRPLLSQGGGWL